MKLWSVVAIALGLIFWFAGDALANIGSDVDALIDNKWFATGLIGVGAIGLAVETKAFSRL